MYILECSDGSYYVGSTNDLERRLSEHNSPDLGSAYTRKRQPVTVAGAWEFDHVSDAFYFEKQVQGWNRAKRKALIDGRYDLLPVLASRSWSSKRAILEGD